MFGCEFEVRARAADIPPAQSSPNQGHDLFATT